MILLDRLLNHKDEYDSFPELGKNMVCPVCEFEYVHTELPIIDSCVGKNGCIKIPMYCEDGHPWELVLDSHKGLCGISVRNIKDRLE